MPREGLLALVLAIGCTVPRPASDPSPAPAPTPAPAPAPVVEVVPPVPTDPCAGVVAFDERHQPQAPKRRSCEVTSAGECPYRDPSKPLAPSPYSEEELDELRAHDTYARCGDDPERVRDARYMRFQILAEHRDLGRELALVEAFIEEYDGHPLAAWAAFLLLDELTLRATESEVRSIGDLEAIVRWIERLETMALWKLESAEDLRPMTPTLQAGASWQLGLEARERGRYAECADRFLAISNRHDDHDRRSDLLLFASECLAADLRIDEALALRREMLERFSSHPDVEDWLWSLARLELATARYEDALDDFLVFARGASAESRFVVPHTGPVFTHDPDPRRDEALIAAYPIAAALGRRRDLDEIRELFGHRDPHQDPTRGVAVAHWDMRPASGRPLEAFARRQLERFQDAWLVGALEAQVALGERAWGRACSGRIVDGLCVSKQHSNTTKRCTLSGVATPRVRPRRARAVDAAMAEFQRVIDRGLGNEVSEQDEARGRAALAVAEFHLLEPKLELYLSRGPDVADARENAEALDGAYGKLAAGADVVIAIRASARVAQIWEMLANAGLHRLAEDEPCTAKNEDAQEAVERTRLGYEACLGRAIEARHFDDIARRCEAALANIDPGAFPVLAEIVPEPSVSPAPLRGAGVQPPPSPPSARQAWTFMSAGNCDTGGCR